MDELTTTIQANLQTVRALLQQYEQRYHRPAHSVFLLAASKGQSIKKIQAALQAGQHAFAENYLQEALPKIEAFATEQIEWHFIGPIQRNKTRKIAEQFSWVHTVADEVTAKRLSEQRPSHLPPLNICIQVNVSEEQTKSGVFEAFQVEALARYCLELPHLQLRGLMAVPAIKDNFIEQCAEFHKLRTLMEFLIKKGIVLDTLSMGMSGDMEAAVAEGTTMVRIGTAIFGPRF